MGDVAYLNLALKMCLRCQHFTDMIFGEMCLSLVAILQE